MRVRNSFASVPSNGSWRRKHSYKCLMLIKILKFCILYEFSSYGIKLMIVRMKHSLVCMYIDTGAQQVNSVHNFVNIAVEITNQA